MRQWFINFLLIFFVGLMSISHLTALAVSDLTCADVNAEAGLKYYVLEEGDLIVASFKETVGNVDARLNLNVYQGIRIFDKTVFMKTPGTYWITYIVPADGSYALYPMSSAAATGKMTMTCNLVPDVSAATVQLVPQGDPDGDGVSGTSDNCPYAYNPNQEDGWGSAMGDACDTDWYNMSGIGLAGFEQKDGSYHLHGNCTFMADGDPRCPEIGVFDPSGLTPEAMPMEVTTEYAGTWSVWVYYLYTQDGVAVYQVNIYSTNPPQPDTLVDDRLELHVNADGSWQWYQRGGSSQYNGL